LDALLEGLENDSSGEISLSNTSAHIMKKEEEEELAAPSSNITAVSTATIAAFSITEEKLGDATTSSTANTEIKQEEQLLESSRNAAMTNDNTTSIEMDQLRAIVQEQGRIMECMLQEQTRLNRMVQAAFQQNKVPNKSNNNNRHDNVGDRRLY
jgi:hypothetical protein